MQRRRQFLKVVFGALSGAALLLSPLTSMVRRVVAMAGKVILPRGTDRKTLVGKDPATLDTRNLEVTPLQEFGTMGLTDYRVDPSTWRLSVTGAVAKPLSLSYEEVTAMPVVERRVLMICPGVFANHGLWKGVSIKRLLDLAKAEYGVTHVTLRGPAGAFERTERYPLEDVLTDRVFLAHEVNGKRLPEKHGFPLRVVAEGCYGFDWLKYVYTVVAEKIAAPEKG
jgi:DMSO/TMAO reductase YedYZ molybdopterin-dependent catalytic subunit